MPEDSFPVLVNAAREASKEVEEAKELQTVRVYQACSYIAHRPKGSVLEYDGMRAFVPALASPKLLYELEFKKEEQVTRFPALLGCKASSLDSFRNVIHKGGAKFVERTLNELGDIGPIAQMRYIEVFLKQIQPPVDAMGRNGDGRNPDYLWSSKPWRKKYQDLLKVARNKVVAFLAARSKARATTPVVEAGTNSSEGPASTFNIGGSSSRTGSVQPDSSWTWSLDASDAGARPEAAPLAAAGSLAGESVREREASVANRAEEVDAGMGAHEEAVMDAKGAAPNARAAPEAAPPAGAGSMAGTLPHEWDAGVANGVDEADAGMGAHEEAVMGAEGAAPNTRATPEAAPLAAAGDMVGPSVHEREAGMANRAEEADAGMGAHEEAVMDAEGAAPTARATPHAASPAAASDMAGPSAHEREKDSDDAAVEDDVPVEDDMDEEEGNPDIQEDSEAAVLRREKRKQWRAQSEQGNGQRKRNKVDVSESGDKDPEEEKDIKDDVVGSASGDQDDHDGGDNRDGFEEDPEEEEDIKDIDEDVGAGATDVGATNSNAVDNCMEEIWLPVQQDKAAVANALIELCTHPLTLPAIKPNDIIEGLEIAATNNAASTADVLSTALGVLWELRRRSSRHWAPRVNRVLPSILAHCTELLRNVAAADVDVAAGARPLLEQVEDMERPKPTDPGVAEAAADALSHEDAPALLQSAGLLADAAEGVSILLRRQPASSAVALRALSRLQAYAVAAAADPGLPLRLAAAFNAGGGLDVLTRAISGPDGAALRCLKAHLEAVSSWKPQPPMAATAAAAAAAVQAADAPQQPRNEFTATCATVVAAGAGPALTGLMSMRGGEQADCATQVLLLLAASAPANAATLAASLVGGGADHDAMQEHSAEAVLGRLDARMSHGAAPLTEPMAAALLDFAGCLARGLGRGRSEHATVLEEYAPTVMAAARCITQQRPFPGADGGGSAIAVHELARAGATGGSAGGSSDVGGVAYPAQLEAAAARLYTAAVCGATGDEGIPLRLTMPEWLGSDACVLARLALGCLPAPRLTTLTCLGAVVTALQRASKVTEVDGLERLLLDLAAPLTTVLAIDQLPSVPAVAVPCLLRLGSQVLSQVSAAAFPPASTNAASVVSAEQVANLSAALLDAAADYFRLAAEGAADGGAHGPGPAHADTAAGAAGRDEPLELLIDVLACVSLCGSMAVSACSRAAAGPVVGKLAGAVLQLSTAMAAATAAERGRFRLAERAFAAISSASAAIDAYQKLCRLVAPPPQVQPTRDRKRLRNPHEVERVAAAEAGAAPQLASTSGLARSAG